MRSLLTSYLLQSKECVLPGIGVLQFIHTPASTDVVNNQLLPAYEAIIFKSGDHPVSPGLIKYIAGKKHINLSDANDLLDSFCTEWKGKIDAGEKLHFETLGTIYKNAEGAIDFDKEKGFNYFDAIKTDSVYQKAPAPVVIEDAPLPVLQEVNEYTPVNDNTEVHEYNGEKIVIERSYWGLWALILLAAGAVMLFYHFKDHTPSASTIGNKHKIIVDSAGPTYNLSK